MSSNSRIDFYIVLLPGFLPMDLAGPLQVLLTANEIQPKYRIHYIGPKSCPSMQGGLSLQNVEPLPKVLPIHSRLLIPGINDTQTFINSAVGKRVTDWLAIQKQQNQSFTMITVCSGALIAAKAGFLRHKKCTTHHDLLNDLRVLEPLAQIESNRLFVEDDNLWTSAGISSGVDLILALVQRDFDPAFAASVAREMVVYLRRGADDPQLSPWLLGRNHIQARIHQVQDLISQDIESTLSIAELARKVNMSSRNLTRQFQRYTAQTVHAYREQIRIAQAENLLRETDSGIELIANACGFQSARSFRRAWNRFHACLPKDFRAASRR